MIREFKTIHYIGFGKLIAKKTKQLLNKKDND